MTYSLDSASNETLYYRYGEQMRYFQIPEDLLPFKPISNILSSASDIRNIRVTGDSRCLALAAKATRKSADKLQTITAKCTRSTQNEEQVDKEVLFSRIMFQFTFRSLPSSRRAFRRLPR